MRKFLFEAARERAQQIHSIRVRLAQYPLGLKFTYVPLQAILVWMDKPECRLHLHAVLKFSLKYNCSGAQGHFATRGGERGGAFQ